MSSRSLHSIIVSALCLAFVAAWVSPARAIDFSSLNFITRGALMDQGGGSATSTSFSSLMSFGQQATGVSTSASFEVRAGTMYLESFTPKTQNWRWYDDENNETPTSALAGENVAPSGVANLNPIKLRITLKETASIGSTGTKFFLQYATSSDFATPHPVAEQSACTAFSIWCYESGAGGDNSVITTKTLSDADACAGGTGNGCGTHNSSGISVSNATQAKDAAAEYEFTIQAFGAPGQTTYFFRVVMSGATTTVPLNTGANYPSLVSEGATLSFSIDGLPVATTTSGVQTTVTTTPNAVPFGTLAMGSSTIAAHRLTVSTSASGGYRVFAYQQQKLLSDGNAEIPGISATNDIPAGWASACTGASSGCWGYHTNASVLSGNSTRFAPDDSYAQFDSTAREVAYGAGPTTNHSTDMVYRVTANDQQSAGAYSTNITYIITPIF